jgi:hypothetical protein
MDFVEYNMHGLEFPCRIWSRTLPTQQNDGTVSLLNQLAGENYAETALDLFVIRETPRAFLPARINFGIRTHQSEFVSPSSCLLHGIEVVIHILPQEGFILTLVTLQPPPHSPYRIRFSAVQITEYTPTHWKKEKRKPGLL